MFLKVGFSENSHPTNCFCPNYGVLLFMMPGEVFFSVSSISVRSRSMTDYKSQYVSETPMPDKEPFFFFKKILP